MLNSRYTRPSLGISRHTISLGVCAHVFESNPQAELVVFRSDRYERSWGHLFESFDQFLSFSWPVITVTDASTGRAHIVTRFNSIGAFLKMIKTR